VTVAVTVAATKKDKERPKNHRTETDSSTDPVSTRTAKMRKTEGSAPTKHHEQKGAHMSTCTVNSQDLMWISIPPFMISARNPVSGLPPLGRTSLIALDLRQVKRIVALIPQRLLN
jgi:hypothetical protein